MDQVVRSVSHWRLSVTRDCFFYDTSDLIPRDVNRQVSDNKLQLIYTAASTSKNRQPILRRGLGWALSGTNHRYNLVCAVKERSGLRGLHALCLCSRLVI